MNTSAKMMIAITSKIASEYVAIWYLSYGYVVAISGVVVSK